MTENKIFLFPHSVIPNHIRKYIPAHIIPTTICKPWYMEIREEESEFEIIFPDERLKPPKNFLNLIKEYKIWMKDQDKGNALFMIMEKEIWNSEETPRHIKTLIKAENKESTHINSLIYDSIKWHLILHLATEFESDQFDIDKGIKDLTRKDPPLKDIVEESPVSMDYLLKDLISYGIDPILDERIIKEIIEAWINLFIKYIENNSLLFTFSKDIFYYLKGIFEDALTKDISKKGILPIKEEKAENHLMIKVSFPVLLDNARQIENFLSGKDLICLIC